MTGGCIRGWNTVFDFEVEVVSRSGRGDTYSQFYLKQSQQNFKLASSPYKDLGNYNSTFLS